MAKGDWSSTSGCPGSYVAGSDLGTLVHLEPICMPQATHPAWNRTSWDLKAGDLRAQPLI